MKIQKLTALLVAVILLTAAIAQEGKKEAKKELSNTRIASCLVKVTCNPAALPLNFGTIERLLHSSRVGGKAIREMLGITVLTDETEELVHFGIKPLSDESSSDAPKGRPYGVALDEEEEYFREMKVVPKMRAFVGRKEPAMPIPGGPTYASQETLFFRLFVELEHDVKPAAEEFMKALTDNLRKTLDAACDHHRTKLDRRMNLAHDYAMHAKANLTGVQEKLREILGSYNLERQAILDDITRLRRELQAIKMELETNHAFIEATSKRILETEAKMRHKIDTDPVLDELQKIIGMHEERLKTLVNKAAPEPETSQARENLARARIELAERREQISRSAGAELINSLRNQISELTIQRAQALKRMDRLGYQLQEAQDLLPKADEYERISLELKIAKEVLEESLLLHSRMKRKSLLSLLIQPSVFVFGAE